MVSPWTDQGPQPTPGSLSSPTFAPDQLLQLILQGWKSYSGSLYYFSLAKKTWEEAEQFCVSQGAHLASVTSEEEQVRAVGLGGAAGVEVVSGTLVLWPSPSWSGHGGDLHAASVSQGANI